jgi:hypothetical protein
MFMDKMFYTYAYLREDKTPYYIGKGKGKRLYKTHRDTAVPKDKSRIIFLKTNLTEGEAFMHEIYMISILGRKDLGTGILRNRTNGGEGSAGHVPTEERKRNQSERMRGENHPLFGKPRTEEWRKTHSQRMTGENNPMYGKKRGPMSEEQKRKISEAMKGNQNRKTQQQ